MLAAFDGGEFDTVIVTETSRLTRSLRDVIEITEPRRNLRVIVTKEGVDTDDTDFLLKQFAILAEREVRLKSQRAQRYAKERHKIGHPSPGRTPFGYNWVPVSDRDEADTRYKINEPEAAIVRRIFNEYLSGGTMGQIGSDLTKAGLLTRQNVKWHASTVRRILMNPQYAALLAPVQPTGKFDISSIDLDECIPGAWEPIVSREQIAATRSLLVGVKAKHQGNARKWILSGLATCAVCDGSVRSARGGNTSHASCGRQRGR